MYYVHLPLEDERAIVVRPHGEGDFELRLLRDGKPLGTAVVIPRSEFLLDFNIRAYTWGDVSASQPGRPVLTFRGEPFATLRGGCWSELYIQADRIRNGETQTLEEPKQRCGITIRTAARSRPTGSGELPHDADVSRDSP